MKVHNYRTRLRDSSKGLQSSPPKFITGLPQQLYSSVVPTSHQLSGLFSTITLWTDLWYNYHRTILTGSRTCSQLCSDLASCADSYLRTFHPLRITAHQSLPILPELDILLQDFGLSSFQETKTDDIDKQFLPNCSEQHHWFTSFTILSCISFTLGSWMCFCSTLRQIRR